MTLTLSHCYVLSVTSFLRTSAAYHGEGLMTHSGLVDIQKERMRAREGAKKNEEGKLARKEQETASSLS